MRHVRYIFKQLIRANTSRFNILRFILMLAKLISLLLHSCILHVFGSPEIHEDRGKISLLCFYASFVDVRVAKVASEQTKRER